VAEWERGRVRKWEIEIEKEDGNMKFSEKRREGRKAGGEVKTNTTVDAKRRVW
jgi:hypothetical protein